MLKSDFESKIGAAYKSNSGRSIDPNTIAMIIEMVMKLIQGCTTKRVKNTVEKHPALTHIMISRQLRQEDLKRKDLQHIVQTVSDLGTNATVKEIDDLIKKGIENDD